MSKNDIIHPVNVQKRLIAQDMVNTLAARAGKAKIAGVTPGFYAQLAAELSNYFPGVRTGQVTWPQVFGPRPSGAGAQRPVKVTPKRSTARKPASTRKPATRKPATRKVTPATAGIPQTKPETAAS